MYTVESFGARFYSYLFSPSCQIWVVYPSFPTHMLSRSDSHGLRWRHKVYRYSPGILVRNPYRHGKHIGCTSEVNRQRSREVHKEGRVAIFVGYIILAWWVQRSKLGIASLVHTIYICSRGKAGVTRKRLSNICVGAVDIVVFLGTCHHKRLLSWKCHTLVKTP